MRGGGFYYGELLRLAMKNYTAQRRLWLPSLLRLKLGARRFDLFGLFIVFVLSGSFFAQAQQVEPAPAVTVQELEDLAAVMEDEAARDNCFPESAPCSRPGKTPKWSRPWQALAPG